MNIQPMKFVVGKVARTDISGIGTTAACCEPNVPGGQKQTKQLQQHGT